MIEGSIEKGALLSPCERYRYRLWRTWNDEHPPLLWIMLNPSTADATRDDATIRVCAARAMRMGYGGIDVVNLFALRATDPQELYRAEHPISDPNDPGRNDWEIRDLLHSRHVVCAWGAHGRHLNRGEFVLRMIRAAGVIPQALRLTKAGQPCHPLRIPYGQPLVLLV